MKSIFYYLILLLLFSCRATNKENSPSFKGNELEKRANLFYKYDKFREAEKCFDTLLALNQFNGEIYYKRAYCKYLQQSDNTGAISDFLNAIKYNYKNKKGAFLGIGTIYRILGKYDSALFFYDKSLEIDPNYKKAQRGKKEVIEIIEE
jgi:tetratricopeptide (TPR) repeat protein